MMLWLRRLHRWIGLAAVLPMLMLGITGAVLTLEPVWPHGPEATPGRSRPDADIIAAATALAPPGARPARYTPAGAPGEAAVVAFAGRNASTIRIDPSTLERIGGTEGQGGLLRTMRTLHVNLMLPEFNGRSIVGWCGVALVVLTVFGIPLWWPGPGQWRAAFTFSAAAKGVRFHRRLHGAVGIWIALVLFVNALTGAMLGFPQTVRGWMGLQAGGPPRQGNPAPGAPPAYDVTAAMALARSALPGTQPRFVILPAAAGDPFRVFLAPPGGGAVGAGTATIDAAGTRLLSLQDPSAYTLGGSRALAAAAGVDMAGFRILGGGACIPHRITRSGSPSSRDPVRNAG